MTPRAGKPVEIQALWYNALCVMEALSRDFDPESGPFYGRTRRAPRRRVSRKKFWNGVEGCLFDVVNGDEHDASIRPNQIFAVSLHHGMLTDEQARSVVDVVQRELWTPMGLRTLSANHPQYCGRYEGGPNGTRRRLSPGHGLALADGAVHFGLREGARAIASLKRRS